MNKKLANFCFRHQMIIVVSMILVGFAGVLIYSMNVVVSKSETSSTKPSVVEKIQTEPLEVYKIDNVIKVIINPDDYTVLYRDGKEIKTQRLYEWMGWVKNNRSKGSFSRENNTHIVFETHILEDAPPGKMYVSVEHWNDYFFQAVIHIDDARTVFMK